MFLDIQRKTMKQRILFLMITCLLMAAAAFAQQQLKGHVKTATGGRPVAESASTYRRLLPPTEKASAGNRSGLLQSNYATSYKSKHHANHPVRWQDLGAPSLCFCRLCPPHRAAYWQPARGRCVARQRRRVPPEHQPSHPFECKHSGCRHVPLRGPARCVFVP